MLHGVDEFTHECLAIRVARKLKAIDVIDVLSDLFILGGVPNQIDTGEPPGGVVEDLSQANRVRHGTGGPACDSSARMGNG